MTTLKSNRLTTLPLDWLRGLAATYVLIFHCRWFLWNNLPLDTGNAGVVRTSLIKIFTYAFAFFRYGHEAVILFFVLSGFVIHLRYAKRLTDPKTCREGFDWRAYVFRRMKRLYPPLILAILVTYACDLIGMHQHFAPYLGTSPYATINEHIGNISHSLKTALGNLIFVMDLYVKTFGSNGALWSLKCEWWYYMTYPLFWWLSKKSIRVSTILMAVLFILSLNPWIWPAEFFQDIFNGMLIWWLGCLLADIYTGRLNISFKLVSILTLLLPVLCLINGTISGGLVLTSINHLLWGLGFTGLIACSFVWQKKGKPAAFIPALRILADMSYTLYVTHLPLIVLISGWLMSRNTEHTLPHHPGWVLAGMAVCLTFAYITHFIAEKPFVRQKTYDQ